MNQWSQFDSTLEEALEEHVTMYGWNKLGPFHVIHNVVKKYKHNQKMLQRTKW